MKGSLPLMAAQEHADISHQAFVANEGGHSALTPLCTCGTNTPPPPDRCSTCFVKCKHQTPHLKDFQVGLQTTGGLVSAPRPLDRCSTFRSSAVVFLAARVQWGQPAPSPPHINLPYMPALRIALRIAEAFSNSSVASAAKQDACSTP